MKFETKQNCEERYEHKDNQIKFNIRSHQNR